MLLHIVLQPSLSRRHTVNPSLCAVTQCTAAIIVNTAYSQSITLCAVTQCTAAFTLKTAHGQTITLCCYPVYCIHHSQDSTRSTHHFVLLPSVLQPSFPRQHRSTHHSLRCYLVYCGHHCQDRTQSTHHFLCCYPVYCSHHSQGSTGQPFTLCAVTKCTAAIIFKTVQVNPPLFVLLPSVTAAITCKTAHNQPITLCCYPVYCSHYSQDCTGQSITLCCYPVYCSHHSQDRTQSTHQFVLLHSVLQPSLSRKHTVNPSHCAVTQCNCNLHSQEST